MTTHSFEFDTSTDDETDLTFAVTDTFENRYGDQKAVVESPPPWETPDEMTPANEVIKMLEWDDFHYQFDSDREAWTLDVEGLRPLSDLAEEEGYDFEGQARSEAGSGQDGVLEALCEEAQAGEMGHDTDYEYEGGDRISVRYEKKNGNGENVYEGQVTSISEPNDEGYPVGLVFEDDNGKFKKVKRGDRDDVSLFSSGHYPFMGNVLEVTLHR